jgi:[protein-PII] uridylyltransferase
MGLDTQELKAELARLRRGWTDEVPTGGSATADRPWALALGRMLSEGYDALLAPVFREVEGHPVALAAVGGYGRGALALRSDLDVRILARSAADAARVVDAVLYPLWDAGVAIGHQVLLLADVLDVARIDLPTATGLLDWRHLAGDRSLSDELLWRARGSLFSTSELARWSERLDEEIRKRHARFGDSVYLLEPDVKLGAGGLRDLDVLRWVAAAQYGSGEFDRLVRLGAFVPREANELAWAQEVLWQIRHTLHANAGRRSDRLTFDEQEAIAPRLGHGEGGEAVERMMSEYYRAARTVSRGVSMMLSRARVLERRRPKDEDLGDGFRLFDGALTIDDTARLDTEPGLAMRVIAVALERDRPLFPFLRESIARHAGDSAWCERLRADASACRAFVEIVTSRREARFDGGSALRELHELGLLLAMIPEFSPLVGRVHHDNYHVYTVDVHSVAAVDRLAALARGQLAQEHPLASRLAAEATHPSVLAFATLLHDVGKAIGRKDHSERGAELVHTILPRFAFRPDEIAQVAHLVREHLTMYRLATRRDVDDVATVDELASAVRTREMLRGLYLLTVVDVSTTSPTSMTSWKAHMLDDLFLAVDARLSGGSGEIGRRELLRQEIVAAAAERSQVDARAEDLAFLPSFLASMPERYLATTAWSALEHAAIVRRYPGGVSVSLVPSERLDAVELCVVAPDRPGLLSLLAAALSCARLDVLSAQIYSRTSEFGALQAVDVFWVHDRIEGLAGVHRALPRVERELRSLLSGERVPTDVLRPVPTRRGGPRIATRVALDQRASSQHTILEVVTHDRPGVLFAISDALFRIGLSIDVAKINTEGSRVADVFYVVERDGSKVAPGPRVAAVEAAVLSALGEGAATEGIPRGAPGDRTLEA